MAEWGFTVFLDPVTSDGKSETSSSGTKKTGETQSSRSTVSSGPGVDLQAPAGGSVSSMDEMFNLARNWSGHPYLSPSLVMKFGEAQAAQLVAAKSGSSKRAIDCSGFAQEVLGYAGIDPPGDQTAEGLFNYFKTNGTPLKQPQKGALVFFEPLQKESSDSKEWDAGRAITHVAFSLGGGKIMDSSGGRGVSERTLPPEGRFKYHYVMPNYKFGAKGNV